MGAGLTHHMEEYDKKTIEEIVHFIRPIYYNAQTILPYEVERVAASWKIMVNDKAEEYWRLKREFPENVPCKTSIDFFGNRFFKRLIEIHPSCKPLFTKSTMAMGQIICAMFTTLVTALHNGEHEKWMKTIEELVERHNQIGVHAVEYTIFGEVLFFALRLTLGPEAYDTHTHIAWVKFYSKILDVALPIAVTYEREHKETAELKFKRLQPILPKAFANAIINPDKSDILPADNKDDN